MSTRARFALALLLLAPRPSSALGARTEAGVGWVFPASETLASGPGGWIRGSLGLAPTLHVGVEAARSRHRTREAGRVPIDQVALVGSWTLDATPVVPVITASVGTLWVAGAEGAIPTYGAGVGLEWWPLGPLEGPSLAAEVRYTGLLEERVLPVLTWVALRAGWTF